MITEEAAEAASEWLRDHADEVGEARANMVQLEEHRKIVKAKLMRGAPTDCKTASDREAWAYSHPDYKIAADGYAAACGSFERLRQLVTAADARIQLWRTLEASRRAG